MGNTKETLIFLPAFNEERNIEATVEKIKNVVDLNNVDILVVDDGSTDHTGEVSRKLGCHVVRLAKNRGNGKATCSGIDFATRRNYRFVIKLDADGQHDPSYIPYVLDVLKSRMAEYVVCSRYHPLSKRIDPPPDGRRLINIMITETVNALTGSRLTDVSSGFCGYTTSLLRKVKVKTVRYGAPVEMIIRARTLGYDIMELPHPAVYLKKQNPLRLDQYVDLLVNLKNELKWTL